MQRIGDLQNAKLISSRRSVERIDAEERVAADRRVDLKTCAGAVEGDRYFPTRCCVDLSRNRRQIGCAGEADGERVSVGRGDQQIVEVGVTGKRQSQLSARRIDRKSVV